MAYIKRLKMRGFKSFANPTVINFERGFNTIVGANGSGKSNVFDALCFVLGRMSTKGLRTEKLGNLVFNGGKSLKPARDAQVDLFLSNEDNELMKTDLDEIKISRVVKKSGESTYYLNNNKTTRTQIVEILKRANIDPDGYNIILQGDITKIVNMTPIERRELIEEIANISGYEEKRQSGLKKLEKVEVDLKEADLLMEEKTKYIKELKSEKIQAEKFHKTKEEYRFKNLLLIKTKIKKNSLNKEKKLDELKKLESDLEKYRKKLDEFEEESKKIDVQINKIEKTIEVESHKDFISLTNKITSLESKSQNLNEKKADFKKQLEEIKTKKKELDVNIKENLKKLKELESKKEVLNKSKIKLEKELKDIDSKIQILKEGLSDSQFKEIDEVEEEIEKFQKLKLEKNHILQDNKIQIEKLNTKLEHLQKELDKIESLAEQNKEEINILNKNREKLKKLILEISQNSNKHSEISAKIGNLEGENSSLNDQILSIKTKIDASKAIISQNRAVETILKFKVNDPGILGSVLDLISVPTKFGPALERVAGSRLFNIVVDNDKTAVKYIKYLKDNKIGSATFLPLNKINVKFVLDEKVLNKKGVVDYALNLIKFDKKFEKIMHLVFSDTLVIENIEDAKGVGIGEYKMVSLDGDYVSKLGAMSGGFRNKKGGLNLFKDETLEKELQKLEKRSNIIRDSLAHLRDEKNDLEKKIYSLREEKLELEAQIAKSEKILSIDSLDSKNLSKEIEMILGDKSIIESSFNKIKKEIETIDLRLENLNNKKKEMKLNSGSNSIKSLNDLQQKRDELREKVLDLTSKIDAITIQIDNVIIPENVNMKKFQDESNKGEVKLKEEILKLDKEIKSLELEIKNLKQKEKELSKEYKSFIERRDKLKEEKVKLEKKYEKEFSRFDSIKEKIAQIKYTISEFDTQNNTLKEELEAICEELKIELTTQSSTEEFDKLLRDVNEKLNKSLPDLKELQNSVNYLKTRLSSFGSINMKAVEVYDKLNEEFNELLEKRETLNVEKKEILNFIAQIDEKKKHYFLETFNKLKLHFEEVFSKLSSKGQVELEIENEKDLFNSGVNIRVRLSKKNYLDIKSLSGGEKAITAIAFIFAVQEFNPASFYIFDEVDAALDIINAEKLGKLIKDNSHKAQYIVVSHSEHFIQSSQTIFGVAMNSSKISSVVSLDLSSMKDYVEEGT